MATGHQKMRCVTNPCLTILYTHKIVACVSGKLIYSSTQRKHVDAIVQTTTIRRPFNSAGSKLILVEGPETFEPETYVAALALNAENFLHHIYDSYRTTMVSEAVGFTQVSAPPGNDDGRILGAFCQGLGSTSGTVNDSDQTRREAQLLMMLSYIPNDEIIEPLPPCASDSSFSSASSRDSRSFGFSCPSLSLEHPSNSHDFGESPKAAIADSNLHPATLLERSLKVDDRDASRLSADAMARNVLQSFQKAMDWRIEAWMKALTASLLECEHLSPDFGGSLDASSLMETPQGTVLLALRSLQGENSIKVLQTTTSFEALAGTDNPKPTTEYDDEYEMEKPLKLTCEIHLLTPLGYSQIDISSPGSVKGSFSEGELRAVQISLDTAILAAMMEKGCRKVVRTCVEKAVVHLEKRKTKTQPPKTEDIVCEEPVATEEEQPFTVSTPTGEGTEDAAAGNLITPHRASAAETNEEPSANILLPQNLDDHTPLRRRLNRQPISSRDLVSPPPTTYEYTDDDERNVNTPARKRARRAPLVSPMASDAAYHDVGAGGPSLPQLVEAACRARTADC